MPEKLEQNKPFLLRKENRYLWYILILPVYLIAFYIEEHLIDINDCWVSYLPIDDKIPFLEGFIVPYLLWCPLLLAVGLYFLFREHDAFKRYMTFIGVGFLSVTVFYAISPNMQPLRPEVFPRDNFFTRIVGIVYMADTNTNVCPSIHVIGAAAIIIGAFDSRGIRKRPWLLAGIVIFSLVISVSTVFVKQHSILDLITAVPYSLVVWLLVYHLPGWIRNRKKEKEIKR